MADSFYLGCDRQLFDFFINSFFNRSFGSFMNAQLGFRRCLRYNGLRRLGRGFFPGFCPGRFLDFILIKNHKFFSIVNLNSESRFVLLVSYRNFGVLPLILHSPLVLARAQHPFAISVRTGLGNNFREERTRTDASSLEIGQGVARLYLPLFGEVAYLFCRI